MMSIFVETIIADDGFYNLGLRCIVLGIWTVRALLLAAQVPFYLVDTWWIHPILLHLHAY